MRPKPWSWWIDFILVNVVILLAESARGVVLGTLWAYIDSLGGTQFYLAVLVSVFSVGRLIASIVLGMLSDHLPVRSVLIISCVVCVVGNFLYVFSGNSWISSKELVLVSRLLTGFGTGMLSVARTHVSMTTPAEERTLWMSCLGITQYAGFAITPVIGNAALQFNLGILNVTTYTFATFCLLILEGCLIVCLVMFMSKSGPEQSVIAEQETEASIEQSTDTLAEISIDAAAVDDQLGDQITQSINQPQHKNQMIGLPADSTDDQLPFNLTSDLLSEAKEVDTGQATLQSTRSSSTPRSKAQSTTHSPRISTGSIIPSPVHRSVINSPRYGSMGIDELSSSNVVIEQGYASALTADNSNSRSLMLSSQQDSEHSQLPESNTDRNNWSRLAKQSSIPMLFVTVNLIARGVLSVAETYGTQLYNMFADLPSTDTSSASTFLLVLGLLGLGVFLTTHHLTKVVDERTLLFVSFLALGVGFGVIVDFEDNDIDIYDYTAGMTLVWVIGTPLSQTLSVSMLSKHFTSQQAKGEPILRGVGFWMGLVTAAGSVGRIIFPLIAGGLYEPYGANSALFFACISSLVTGLLIFLALHVWRPYLVVLKDKFSRFQQNRNAYIEISS